MSRSQYIYSIYFPQRNDNGVATTDVEEEEEDVEDDVTLSTWRKQKTVAKNDGESVADSGVGTTDGLMNVDVEDHADDDVSVPTVRKQCMFIIVYCRLLLSIIVY